MNASDAARIQRLECQFRDFLEEALRGVPLDLLSEPAIPGKWSALENLAHLGRYREVFQERLDQMLRTKSPSFSRYRAEDDPLWEAWRKLTATEVLTKISSVREQILARLKTLQADDFLQTARCARKSASVCDLLLRGDAAAPLLCYLFFGAEPVLQIVAVFPIAVLVKLVGATANLILKDGSAFWSLH